MRPFAGAWRRLATQGIGRALRHRDFRLYSAANFYSGIGYWAQRVAIGWLIWQLTHEGVWLGIMSACDALPVLFIAPFAGAIADRVDRLKMFRRLQFANFATDSALAALVLSGHASPVAMAALILAGGICNAFMLPLRLTVGPNLVPRPDIPAAISFNSVSFQLTVFVGPAVAGFIITHFGAEYAFLLNCSSYVSYIAVLYVIHMSRDEHAVGKRTGVLADTWEGIRYATRHRAIGPLLLLILVFAMFTRPYLDLMPGLADAVFHRGAQGLAALVSSAGIGGILAGLWLANYGRIERMTGIVLGAVLVLSVVLFVFATTQRFELAVACVVVISAMSTVASTGSQMLIQGSVEGAMRGRVMSLYGITWRGGPALGALAMGGLTSIFGLQAPLAGGAVLCLVAWLFVQPRRRAMAKALESVSPRA